MNESDVAQRFATLLDQYADRISDGVLHDVRGWDAGGEYGEALSVLVASLAETSTTVTAAERDELAALAQWTGEGGEYVAKLTVG